ncbi:hypothetical protein RFI_32404 [Reticulomyxa filosa]|uniref:Fumarylacetoacetase n=1 Tax=Reticulomyxa filosa TaxID=46433 RepID=X6LTN3_RETFI|nr:hypothetical protein RFI_32404 [Reticulomyxa filosa]|eukprot:ETO04994.1 hypothetical protein RFI_32404 [Reticulomyxa filosa]
MAQSPNPSSWVKVSSDSHFSIQNLPYGVFEKANGDRHIGVAIGDHILDLYEVAKAGYFEKSTHLAGGRSFLQRELNEFMGLGRPAWKEARKIIQDLLSTESKDKDRLFLEKECLVAQSQVKMQLPCKIHDYTDFYSSENHASNVGKIIRPNEEPLKPNWKHLPVGYHGIASSVVVSGTPIRRPVGQVICHFLCFVFVSPAQEGDLPTFTACKLLDIELELAFFVGGKCPPMGPPIKIADAYDYLFGVV